MDNPTGRVVSLVDSRDGARAVVEVDAAATCPRCAAGKGCGAGLLSGSTQAALLEVTVAPQMRLKEGDEVRLTLEPSHLLGATLLVYGLPLAGMIVTLLIAWLSMGPLSDGEALIFAVAGLLVGITTARRALKRRDCLKRFVPKIDGTVGVAQ